MAPKQASQASQVMVFVPVSAQEAALVGAGQALQGPRPAFVVTPALLATFGIDATADDGEQAELAALQVASVAGLAAHGLRLVLVGQVPHSQLVVNTGDPNGQGMLVRLAASQVSAYFTDEHPAPRQLAKQVAGQDVDTAWELASGFMATSDLLWHGAEELPAEVVVVAPREDSRPTEDSRSTEGSSHSIATPAEGEPMVTRMHFTDQQEAVDVANKIDAAGFEVAVITEREGDQDQPASYLVAVLASVEQVEPLVPSSVVLSGDTPAPQEPISESAD